MKFSRYRIYVTGHRSQVQVIALLINNWNKLKLYFGFWFLMERVYYDVDFCINCKLMCMDRIARQKQESGLEGSCSDVIDCDVKLH